jgi:hypothetical protein
MVAVLAAGLRFAVPPMALGRSPAHRETSDESEDVAVAADRRAPTLPKRIRPEEMVEDREPGGPLRSRVRQTVGKATLKVHDVGMARLPRQAMAHGEEGQQIRSEVLECREALRVSTGTGGRGRQGGRGLEGAGPASGRVR